MNLPNRLTILRVLMVPVFLWVLMAVPFGPEVSRVVAAVIFVLASATDALDGYIARSRNLVTNFGKFMDPLADKLLVYSALVALVGMNRIWSWVVIVMICREFIVTGFRLVAVEQNVVIAAGFWGKFKTATQMVMIVLVVLQIFPVVTQALVLLAAVLTIVSGVEYVWANRQVLKT